MVYRIYVEKRPEYAVEARGILSEIRHLLRIKSVTGLRLLNRYDVEGISEELFSQCCGTVFSEPQLDFTYTAVSEGADAVFATEFLPARGQRRRVHPAHQPGRAARRAVRPRVPAVRRAQRGGAG